MQCDSAISNTTNRGFSIDQRDWISEWSHSSVSNIRIILYCEIIYVCNDCFRLAMWIRDKISMAIAYIEWFSHWGPLPLPERGSETWKSRKNGASQLPFVYLFANMLHQNQLYTHLKLFCFIYCEIRFRCLVIDLT